MVFPWTALAPSSKTLGKDGSSHLDGHEMSPDHVTPGAQARLAGSYLGNEKTRVALQSPAVVQHLLKRTIIIAVFWKTS